MVWISLYYAAVHALLGFVPTTHNMYHAPS